jgi:PKD repeat protein
MLSQALAFLRTAAAARSHWSALALLLAGCSSSSDTSSTGSGGTDAPTADFSADRTSGPAPLAVSFSDRSTGTVTSWLWDFGDGSGSSQQAPEHTYADEGEYTVSLTVSGPYGSDGETKAGYVRVGGLSADFTADQTSGPAPLAVAFQDLSQGEITSWSWSFGDGGSSTVAAPVHTYQAAGVYDVGLTVRGPDGEATTSRPGFVRVGGLVADFGADDTSGDAPLVVSFEDRSTGQVTGWSWSFGDGASSAQQDPVHTYDEPGVYSVTLAIEGPAGTDSLTRDGFVRVDDPDAQGIWTSARELASLPTTGQAWDRLLSDANRSTASPDISNQDDDTDVYVLAKGLVFARTGEERYRQEVISACRAAIGSEDGGRTLALGRNLIGYVLAADLVGLPAADEADFRAWLRDCLTETLDGRTLVSTHEDRPNNWGTHAGASRAAVAAYLGDQAELDRCALVFRGYLGDRDAYAGFEYGALSWQADPSRPVGCNPKGATKDGHDIDGVLPDDQRRAGDFSWPPPKENYVWEALQGALAQAVVLHRAGYDVWEWEDQALLRAVNWLHEVCNFPASGDDTWSPHVVNHYYGTDFPAPVPSSHGKNVGYTDWTLGPN